MGFSLSKLDPTSSKSVWNSDGMAAINPAAHLSFGGLSKKPSLSDLDPTSSDSFWNSDIMAAINPMTYIQTGSASGKFEGNGGDSGGVSSLEDKGKYITDGQVEDALSDKEHGVSKLMGLLTRKEWADFKERYVPLIEEQADRITSGQNIKEAVEEARKSTSRGFSNARQKMRLNNQRMGLDLTMGQRRKQARSMGLSEAASMVNNVNDARVSARDRDTAILSTGFASSMKTDTGE